MPAGLFVEPFYGGSHEAFADGLRAHSRHGLTLLTLPEREWRRRMRLGAQELAELSRNVADQFDFVIATDMLDLPVFLALTRPRFSSTPVMLYMHENQFTYPRLRGTRFNSWFGQINYLSALAADVVAFNSEFHRQDFLGALRTLAEQPNNWLAAGSIDDIAAKTTVLPVGVELDWLDAQRLSKRPDEPPIILWNHRWEFDKAPELFAHTITALVREGVPFRLAIAGDPGNNPSPEMMALKQLPSERLRHFGYVESREEYARLLWESDIVVSTSRHEFFGMAMVEALYCRCTPLAPRRFNYPALVPRDLHDRCLFEGPAEFEEKLRGLLSDAVQMRDAGRVSAERFGWPAVIGGWDGALDALACGDFAKVADASGNAGSSRRSATLE